MGVHCSFSTGLRYKFGLGLSSEMDMRFFAKILFKVPSINLDYIDEDEEMSDEEKEELRNWIEEYGEKEVEIVPSEIINNFSFKKICRWNKEDLSKILEKIEQYPFPIPDWNRYSLNLRGSINLWEYLTEEIKGDGSNKHQFILGSLIYHQLLYSQVLTATF